MSGFVSRNGAAFGLDWEWALERAKETGEVAWLISSSRVPVTTSEIANAQWLFANGEVQARTMHPAFMAVPMPKHDPERDGNKPSIQRDPERDQ